MGWVWKEDELDGNSNSEDAAEFQNPSNGDYFSTRKIVQSNCRTEEVEPGRFVRKCEKTEEVLKECLGKPTEVVQSNKEYTEEDITDEVMRGSSITEHSKIDPFAFSGLRDDIKGIEHSLFGTIDEMKKDMFRIFDDMASFGSGQSSSSSSRSHGIPIDDYTEKQPTSKRNNSASGGLDLSGLAKDV